VHACTLILRVTNKQLCLKQTELLESDNPWPEVNNVARSWAAGLAYECDHLGDYQIPPLSVHVW
jgi:hypothetical protein